MRFCFDRISNEEELTISLIFTKLARGRQRQLNNELDREIQITREPRGERRLVDERRAQAPSRPTTAMVVV